MTELATRTLGMFDQLDVYSPTGVFQEAPRMDAIATISAGYKTDKGTPAVSRDGKIYLSDPEGRAPGLAEIMRKEPKALTICFPFDDPTKFLQQRFVRYSQTALEVHGDQFGLTEIKGGERRFYPAGSEEYESLKATCKNSVSLYFCLFEWVEGRPRILWPDGPGYYRLRFTSRNSLANIMSTLKMVYGLTGGRLGGAPFVLRMVYRDTADPSGKRRTVPTWTITMRHPENKALTSDDFVGLIRSGAEELEGMRLPPPRPENLEALALELEPDLDAIELSKDDARQLESGIDPAYRRKQWFAGVRDTFLDNDEAREAFLAEHTDGMTSLNDAVKYLDQPEWDTLLAAVTKAIMDREHERLEAQHEATNTDPNSYRDDITEKHLEFLNKQLKRAGVRDVQRFDFLSWLIGQPIRNNRDLTPAHMNAFMTQMGKVTDNKFQPLTDGQLADLMGEWSDFYTSDANASTVL